MIVDAGAGGSIMIKKNEEAYELIEKLASNLHQMAYERIARKPMPEVLQMDAFTALSTQLAALSRKMQS